MGELRAFPNRIQKPLQAHRNEHIEQPDGKHRLINNHQPHANERPPPHHVEKIRIRQNVRASDHERHAPREHRGLEFALRVERNVEEDIYEIEEERGRDRPVEAVDPMQADSCLFNRLVLSHHVALAPH